MKGDEVSSEITIPEEVYDRLVALAKGVYGDGYGNRLFKLTVDERKQLRGDAYRALKALGLEK